MTGAKSITASFIPSVALVSPIGVMETWDASFSWVGLSNATWYLLEVQTSAGVQVFRNWYTAAQTGCAGGTGCGVTVPALSGLANGDYKWRILDYGPYGYGTHTPFMNFTLNR
jgi:hypothetical protein